MACIAAHPIGVNSTIILIIMNVKIHLEDAYPLKYTQSSRSTYHFSF